MKYIFFRWLKFQWLVFINGCNLLLIILLIRQRHAQCPRLHLQVRGAWHTNNLIKHFNHVNDEFTDARRGTDAETQQRQWQQRREKDNCIKSKNTLVWDQWPKVQELKSFLGLEKWYRNIHIAKLKVIFSLFKRYRQKS